MAARLQSRRAAPNPYIVKSDQRHRVRLLNTALLILVVLGLPAPAQQPAAPTRQNETQGTERTTFRSATNQVLLDFVVRDKHQRVIKDLTADDIQVLEDGVPQKILSFTYRGGNLQEVQQSQQNSPGLPGRYNPALGLNIVTIVYENMSMDGRRRAAEIVRDFLKNEIVANTYVGMFMMGYHLVMLQGFTDRADLLLAAAHKASLNGFQDLSRKSQTELATLNRLRYSGPGEGAVDPTSFSPARPGSAEERGPESSRTVAESQKKLLVMEVRMMNQVMGSYTMDQLQALISAQAALPGRKTVLYLAEGLTVPAEMPERLWSVISSANRANVTFYTADCSGLNTTNAAQIANGVAAAIDGAAVGDPSLRFNSQQNMAELAEGTGGSAMLNSNDLRAPLQRVMEEVRSHYEIAYRPTSEKFDGHFRTTLVKVNRPGMKVQSRRGYYALPSLQGQDLLPFELAGMNALSQSPLPKAFPMRTAAFQFRATPQFTEVLVAFEVPTRELKAETVTASQAFKIHPAFVAIIKDAAGEVAAKVSQDIPFKGPADKLEAFRAGYVSVTLPVSLAPGRYTVEAAVVDELAVAASARRSVLVVSSAVDFSLSDLLLTRSAEPGAAQPASAGPLELSGRKITPALDGSIPYDSNGNVALYFVAYPTEQAKPEIRVEVMRDGKQVALLKPADPGNKPGEPIPYFLTIPMAKLSPGTYEFTVTMQQGGKAISHMTVVTLN
jgi:VWFA-related protein